MDEHILSLAETVSVTTDEGSGGGLMFPIIDVLDKVEQYPPSCAQQTNRRAFDV